MWPVLELLINFFSDVKYEEQHITKFNYLNIEKKIKNIGINDLVLKEKTTTHFLTPFLATFSYDLAVRTATSIPSSVWKNPLGNIILSRWSKK